MWIHIRSRSPIHYSGALDCFCRLSYSDYESLVVTALNTVAENPEATWRFNRREPQIQLVRSLVSARPGKVCSLWPHWMKQCFPNLMPPRGLWPKAQIPRSRTKLLNLQGQVLGNWHFNNGFRWFSQLGKFGKHWGQPFFLPYTPPGFKVTKKILTVMFYLTWTTLSAAVCTCTCVCAHAHARVGACNKERLPTIWPT